MLQSMGLQRVGHNGATEQQQIRNTGNGLPIGISGGEVHSYEISPGIVGYDTGPR